MHFKDQYLTSLYWSFMTMTTVGYGDVVPHSSEEKLLSIFMMIISCGVFAWIMGSIGSVIGMGDAHIMELKDEINCINSFMMANKIPKGLRLKVRHYLDYLVEYKSQFKLEEEEVVAMLSENLRHELTIHLNGAMLH